MDWYYAINGQRVGPVSESNFAQLVANGVITDDTLVWRKGMEQWTRWDEVAPAVELPSAERIPTMPGFSPETTEEVDAEETWTTDEFWARLQEQGFVTSVGGCMGRAWEVYKSAFWPSVGVTALGFLILMVVGMIPLAGFLSAFFLTPQITAGLHWYFVQRARGEAPGIETIFTGFKQSFLPLAGLGLAQLIVAIVPVGVIVALMTSMGLFKPEDSPDFAGAMALSSVLLLIVVVLLMMFVYMRLLLAYLIVIDLGAGVMDALKLSWRIVGRKIWTMLGLMVMVLLLSIAGMLALFVGLLFVLPMYYAIFAQLYEDARNSARGQPPSD